MAASNMDSDDNEPWDSSSSIGDTSPGQGLLNASRISVHTSVHTSESSTQVREGDAQLPALMSDSDSDDDSTWNMGGYSSGSSDTSDGEYLFNGNVSDASDDSSIADDDDDYGVFEMLSNHFDVFNNFVPAFFGVSLQMLYARIMENITLDEERDSPTPQHILDLLPANKVTVAQVASNLSCCICFCDYVLNEDLLELPCSHIYHKTCILDWLKIKCTCPTCRCDLTSNATDPNEPNELSDFSSQDNNSSSENLVYNMDREHIYDTIESYNTHALSSNNHSVSTDNITDLPTMSTSNILVNNSININSSAASDIRTPAQSAQQSVQNTSTSGSGSSNTRTRSRTRFVTHTSAHEGASNSSSTDIRTTSRSSEEVVPNNVKSSTKRFSRETEIW